MALYACLHCLEDIHENEPYQALNGGVIRVHLECFTRMLAGSVGHQLGRCPCHGGDEDDPPGMTPRQAAIAARDLYFSRREF